VVTSSRGGPATRRRSGRKGSNAIVAPPKIDLPVQITAATISVEALAAAMDAKPAEVIKYLMINMGIMATITQSVDAESAVVVAEAFGKKVVRQAQPDEDAAELAADTVALSGTLESYFLQLHCLQLHTCYRLC
jgi:translation initiation factor IF-2